MQKLIDRLRESNQKGIVEKHTIDVWNQSDESVKKPKNGNKRQVSKAELLQLNRTQFSSLGIFISKKLEIEKTKTTFIISVLKDVC